MKTFWTICILQCVVVLTLAFGDIGFDKPGRLGLDFDHFLILLLIQGCLVIGAVSMAFRTRRWNYLGVQFLLLVVTAVGIMVGEL